MSLKRWHHGLSYGNWPNPSCTAGSRRTGRCLVARRPRGRSQRAQRAEGIPRVASPTGTLRGGSPSPDRRRACSSAHRCVCITRGAISLSCSNHFAFALVPVLDLGKSCGIAAWPRQPRDKAGGDRIGGLHEHDATSSAGVFANVVGAVRGPPEVDPLLRPSIQPDGDELAPFDDRFPTRSVSGYRVCSA